MSEAASDPRDTEQKRIEGELRASEERFRLATEAAGMFAWEGDLASGAALWSANAATVIGCRPEDLPSELSRSHFFIAVEDVDRVVGDYTRALAVRRDTYSTEYRGACELSATKFFRSDTRILYDAMGNPIRILGVTQDITDRRVAEEALRQSEDRFRGTFENADVGMAHVAPDGRWLRVNNRLCEMTGYPRAELLTKTFGDLTYPDDLEADWALARRVLAGEIPTYSIDKRYVRKDGSIIWISLTVALACRTDGEPDFFISVIRDISAHKKAEAALEERERFARRVLDNLFAFVGVTTPDGTAIQVNRAPLEAAGIQASDVLGRKIWETFWFAGVPEREAQLRDALERAACGELVRYDVAVRMAGDSPMWIDFQIAPLRDDTGRITHLIPSAMDISARHEAEQRLEASLRELREAQDELVRRERLATLGQLAGGVAHELRTPLSVMRNSVYYLEHVLPQSDVTIREILGEMQRAIVSSDHIIGEMLDFVREPSHETRVFPIGMAISRALQLVPPPQTVLLTGPLGDLEAPVLANQDQVTRILVNVIQNAIQAMLHGGGLEIRVNREEGAKVSIAVTDTGCGIPPENLEKIFDALFTTKTRGIGLGLAISLRYAKLNGGSLTVESEEGIRTTFTLTLKAPVLIGNQGNSLMPNLML